MENTHYLAHHGIKGQKWGVRKYQNADGSLTAAGQGRYNKISNKYGKQLSRSSVENQKIYASREQYRAKLNDKIAKLESKKNSRNAAKIDKKIEKNKARLADQKAGDKYVNAGLKRYDKTISQYRDMKLKAITNPDIKKTENYKKIANAYFDQKYSDLNFGSNYTKLKYAFASAPEPKSERKTSPKASSKSKSTTDKIESKVASKGGKISKQGGQYKYVASNGTVIAKSRNGSINVGRHVANSAPVYTLVKGQTPNKARREAMDKERAALKEYWSAGGDKMLKKYNKAKK